MWICQTKSCSGSASVLWPELPVTKPRSRGVKCANSPVRLKSCQCRATIGRGECFSCTAVYFHPLWVEGFQGFCFLKQNASIWSAHWNSSGDWPWLRPWLDWDFDDTKSYYTVFKCRCVWIFFKGKPQRRLNDFHFLLPGGLNTL